MCILCYLFHRQDISGHIADHHRTYSFGCIRPEKLSRLLQINVTIPIYRKQPDLKLIPQTQSFYHTGDCIVLIRR